MRSIDWKRFGLLAVVIAISLPALAQGRPPGRGGDPEQRVEQEMERLTRDLDLTDEQQPRVKAILVESATKVQRAFQAGGGDREAMHGTLQKIGKQTESKLAEVLDDQQLARYREIVEERRNRRRSRQGGGPPQR